MKILLGGFQSGKTEAVLKEAALCSRRKESFLIISPSRLLNTAALSRFLSLTKASAGRPVVTLGGLQQELMERCFPNPALRPKTLSNFEQFLFISSIIGSLEKKFQAFSGISKRPRLIKNLYSLVRSLRDEDTLAIPSEGALKARAEDLQMIIRSYQELLGKRGLCDSALSMQLLTETLPSSDYTFARHIFIDGFTDLTSSQFKFLSSFIRCAEKAGSQVTLTLPLSRSALSKESLELFEEAFPQAEKEILPSGLSFGEAFLSGESLENPPKIYEIQAFGLHKECEETANQIKKLLLFEGLQPRDILIISPKHESYTPILNSVFRKAGLPLYFTKDELLKQNPLIIFIRQCLQMMGQNISHETLGALAKSNYLKNTLRRAFASAPLLVPQALEGPPALWKKFASENSEAPNREEFLAALALLESSLLSPEPHKKYPAHIFLGALTAFLEACGISEKALSSGAASASLDAASLKDYSALQKLRDIFAQLKKSLILLGDETLNLRNFVFYFDSIIEETRYRAEAPKSGALTVISLDEARGLQAEAVFFLGMNEGAFPPAPSWDLFDNANRVSLNRSAKEVLGRGIWDTDLKHFQRSKFLFASALSLAKSSLYFCRTPADERGNYLPQSHFLTRILSLAPFTRIPEFQSREARANNPEIFSLTPPAESIYASCFLPLTEGSPAVHRKVQAMRLYRLELEQACSALEKGVLPQDGLRYFGGLGSHSAAAQKYQEQEIHISPTKIDAFGRCLYRGLWAQVWKVRSLSLPQYKPEAVDTGVLYHKVLEAYLKQAGIKEFDGALLKNIIIQKTEEFPQKAVFLLGTHHIYAVLSSFLKTRQAELAKSQIPEYMELPSDTLKIQSLGLGGIKVQVHGVLDRIDLDQAQGRHIIDYKSRGSAYPDYFKTLFCLFQGSLYAMLLEANSLGPVRSISYMFLEKGGSFAEYPALHGQGKNKSPYFSSMSAYCAYKKEELLALIGILKQGIFLPYTLPALVPLKLHEDATKIYGGFKFEHQSKCTYCEYKEGLCLRKNKLISKQAGD